MDEVTVDLGRRSYPVLIGRDLLSRAGRLLKDRIGHGKVLVVTNPLVGTLYGDTLCRGLRNHGFEVFSTQVPDGEKRKTLKWVSRLYEVLFEHGLDRSSTVVAQVDAGVGGKVGVDHPRGKNMIGAFYQPAAVLADLDVLKTLAPRQRRNGLAEVIKYGVIADGEFFSFLEQHLNELLRCDLTVMRSVVKRSCQIKARVVATDERETGERAILNFGHTLGHAIEAAAGYRTHRHGEAVAIGMVYAAEIAVRMSLTDDETHRRLAALLKSAGLPTEDPQADEETVMEFMKRDKKVYGGRVRFVLPRTIGHVEIFDDVPEQLIHRILKEHRS